MIQEIREQSPVQAFVIPSDNFATAIDGHTWSNAKTLRRVGGVWRLETQHEDGWYLMFTDQQAEDLLEALERREELQ